MNTEDNKTTYPRLPGKHWWTLREKFKQTIPGTVTTNYLSTTLNIKEISARTNVLPFLKTIGLIDSDGNTNSDLAIAWRDDEQYSKVCKIIRETIYPEELRNAVPDPAKDPDAAKRWFSNSTGAGLDAVRKMANCYTLLSEADVLKKPSSRKPSSPKTSSQKSEKTTTNKIQALEEKDQTIANKKKLTNKPMIDQEYTKTKQELANKNYPNTPSININLEIHISSDATADQIDKIFESMAKHIYSR